MTAASDQAETASAPSPPRKPKSRPVLVPYLLLIATQLPLVLVYLWNLWSTRDHYVLLPLAIFASLGLLVLRLPPDLGRSIGRNRTGSFLLLLGVVLGILGALLVTPWLAYASFLAIASSLLVRIPDKNAATSLLPVITPLLVLLQPPSGFDFETVNGDIALVATVKTTATSLASDLLDVPVVKVLHDRNVTLIEMPGKLVDANELGNGLQSVFSLLILTAIYIAALRRPFFRGLMLLLATIFWATCILSLHIALICIGLDWFEQDYQTGSTSSMLYVTLWGISVVLILASDQFIGFLFGPVDMTAIDESASQQTAIGKFWNRFLAGDTQSEAQFDEERRYQKIKPLSERTEKFVWVSAIVLGIGCVLQIVDIGRAATVESASAKSISAALSDATLNDEMAGWSRTEYQAASDDDEPKATYLWVFANSEANQAQVSLAHTYPGWNRLLKKYQRDGWILESRENVRSAATSDGDDEWQFIHATFRKPFGQACHVLFCNMDFAGQPYEIPVTWSDPSSFISRMFGRLGNRVTCRLLSPGSIQLHVECISETEISDESGAQVRQLFLESRTKIQNAVSKAK